MYDPARRVRDPCLRRLAPVTRDAPRGADRRPGSVSLRGARRQGQRRRELVRAGADQRGRAAPRGAAAGGVRARRALRPGAEPRRDRARGDPARREAVRLERASVPSTFPLEVADHLRANGIEVKADRELFIGRRRVKNDAELAGIRRAQRAAEGAMQAARELLRAAEPQNGGLVVDGEPLTCERLKLAVEQVFTEHGVFADEFIVSHGAQTAIGHDMGSGPIAPNEPICLDLFPRDRESGCYADMTRTFVVGEPSDELREYHKLCREALDRAVAAVKPGIPGKDLNRLACDIFEEHGFPTLLSKQPGEVLKDGFYHSLGHGVGLEVHEEPALGRGPGELVAGDVIAVEPGLYRNGYGGCRLEDLVHVTEDGAEILTDYPYDLEP